MSKATAAGFGALGAYGASKDYQNRSNDAISNMESAIDLRGTQATIFEQQQKEITERLGQQLTREDLITLQAAGRLKAAQGGSGTSGGTSDLHVAQAYVIGARNREVLMMKAGDDKIALARRNIMSALDSKTRLRRMASDIPTADEITLGILGQTMNGIYKGYQFGENMTGFISEKERKEEIDRQTNVLKVSGNNVLSGYKSVLER